MSVHVSAGNGTLPNLSGFSSVFFQSLESTRRMLQLVEEVRTYTSFALLFRAEGMEKMTLEAKGFVFFYLARGMAVALCAAPSLLTLTPYGGHSGCCALAGKCHTTDQLLFCPHLLLETNLGRSCCRGPGVRDKRLSWLQSSGSLVPAPL